MGGIEGMGVVKNWGGEEREPTNQLKWKNSKQEICMFMSILSQVRESPPNFPQIDTYHNTESLGLTFVMHHIED